MAFLRNVVLLALSVVSISTTAQHLSDQFKIKTASKAYHKLSVDSSGNYFVYGQFDDLDGQNHGRLLKLDPSGNRILDFNSFFADGAIGDIVIQPDQKILVSGEFTTVNGQEVPSLLRLNTDGSIDSTFTSELESGGNIELQSTGKIIVLAENQFRRLNADGSHDNSFDFQNFVSSHNDYTIAPDNSIFYSDGTRAHKLTSEGILDNSFYIGAGASGGFISALKVQRDGKLIIGGSFSIYNGVNVSSIVRLDHEGNVDETFKPGDFRGNIFNILQRSNGQILVGGQFDQYEDQPASLVDLNADGTLARIIAIVHTNWITTIIEGPDSKITIGGEFENVNGVMVNGTCRFNTNYTIDKTFLPKITYNNSNGLQICVDETLQATVIGTSELHGLYHEEHFLPGGVFRINPFGKPENSEIANSYLFASLVQTNGQVILSGSLGFSEWGLFRFNRDGSRDNTFNTGSGATTEGTPTAVYSLHQIEEQIFVGGSFTHFNQMPSQSLVALDPDGKVVHTFDALPSGSHVYQIRHQSDGKLVLTGEFGFDSGVSRIVRLNQDGTLDQDFHRPSMHYPSDIAIDSADNIYITGDGLNPDGALLRHIIKLTPDGFLDDSFSVGVGFEPWGYLTAVNILPNGNIAVGGHFDYVQGVEQPGFAVLDPSGTLIPQEQTLFGKGSAAVDIFVKDEHVFLAGKFKTRDYKDAYSFVKVLFNNGLPPAPPSDLSVSFAGPGSLSVNWTNNSSDHTAFIVERSINALENFVIIDTVDANIFEYDDTIVKNNFHVYRVRSVNDFGSSEYSNTDSIEWIALPEGTIALTASLDAAPNVNLSWQGQVLYHQGYIVEYLSSDSVTYVPIDTVDAEASTLSYPIEINTPYTFRVRAYNENGTLSSDDITVEWHPLPQGELNLSVSSPVSENITLSWTHNLIYLDGFIVEMAIDNSNEYIAIDTLNSESLTLDYLIEPATEYHFRVIAYNENGTVTFEPIRLEWILSPEGTLDLSINPTAWNDVQLSWTGEVTYHDGFIIEKAAGPGTNFEPIDTVDVNTTSFGYVVDEMQQYQFRVAAFNASGRVNSNEVSFAITSIEGDARSSVQFFPNPTKEFISISNSADNNLEGLSIIDENGRVFYTTSNPIRETQPVDVRKLRPGVYFINTSIKGRKIIKRFVKE